jgi:phosphoserine aminotransferase
MSSEFLARPIPWDLVDVVFGGVQKNLGPAGMAVVFVRTSILEDTRRDLAAYFRFDAHADKDSMYNTPPVFTVWMTGKVLRWMEAKGGTPAIERDAAAKAAAIYEVIDESDGWFRSPVEPAHRSHMNIVWRLPNDDLETAFLAASKERGMLGLKGHRSVGGIRASVYAAMPPEGVDALVDLMRSFRSQHA